MGFRIPRFTLAPELKGPRSWFLIRGKIIGFLDDERSDDSDTAVVQVSNGKVYLRCLVHDYSVVMGEYEDSLNVGDTIEFYTNWEEQKSYGVYDVSRDTV